MGLLPTPMNQDAAPPPPEDQGNQPQDDQPNVSPEEQQMYDLVMHKASDLIYGTGPKGKVMPEILKALEPAKDAPQQGGGTQDGDGSDPESSGEDQQEGQDHGPKGNPAVMALANTATQIVNKLDTSSQQAGTKIPDDVLYHAGAEIIEMLGEIAEAAKIHSYTQDELSGAFYQAVDNYRPIAERMGRTDDATLKQQFGEIVQADEQGKLGDVVPGLPSPQPGADGGAPPQQGQGQPS